MDEEEDFKPDETKKSKAPLYVFKEKMFEGKSAYESYNHFNHMVGKDFQEEYFILIKTIKFGYELLPEAVDDPGDREKIAELKKKSNTILMTILETPSQKVGWTDPASKTFPSITLSSNDGGTSSFPPELYEQSEKRFRENQFMNNITELRITDSMIYRFLVKYNVISRTKPFKELIEDKLKERYSKKD